MEPTAFRIDEEIKDGVCVLALSGELDLATSPQLDEALNRATAEGRAVVVDLTACDFIDSTGIAVVVRAWQRLDAGDGAPGSRLLALCSPAQQVRKLLDITGVGSTISVFDDCDDAVPALRRRAGAGRPG